MQEMNFKMVGTRPLLMKNGQGADPMHPLSKLIKKITSKGNKKTEEDIEQLRYLEWRIGLYLDESDRPALPGDVVLACLIAGAKKHKLGPKMKAGVLARDPFFPLLYDGPRDLDALYKAPGFCDYRAVKVNGRKVMRARPRFAKWSCEVAFLVDPSIVDPEEVTLAFHTAGDFIGIGDWRPQHGRFEVQS